MANRLLRAGAGKLAGRRGPAGDNTFFRGIALYINVNIGTQQGGVLYLKRVDSRSALRLYAVVARQRSHEHAAASARMKVPREARHLVFARPLPFFAMAVVHSPALSTSSTLHSLCW